MHENNLRYREESSRIAQEEKTGKYRRDFALGTMLLGLPTGYLVAVVINESAYDLEHTYFT